MTYSNNRNGISVYKPIMRCLLSYRLKIVRFWYWILLDLFLSLFLNFRVVIAQNFSSASNFGNPHSTENSIPDTLYISNYSSTYLAFPQDIDIINIGSTDFIFHVEKSIVFIKATRPTNKITNMFMKCGQGIFTINLVYQEKPKKSLYDFRKINFDLFNEEGNKSTSEQGTFSSSSKALTALGVKDRKIFMGSNAALEDLGGFEKDSLQKKYEANAKLILAYPDRFKTFGTAQNRITILLTDLLTDSKWMYLKFKVSNKSSLNYDFDYTSFQLLRSKMGKKNLAFTPLYYSPLESCLSHTKEKMVFILPLFAETEQGNFKVVFRELHGDRKISVLVPDRAFKMASIFH